MADLTGRLQAALGSAYRLENELGGGGMSRVFLAEELRLGRKVVVKVLPPEMAAGVNVDRFEREIQLAARLQHPHIVPLLTTGAEGDLLYYIMPFIEGESLRARLTREGELPVRDTIGILREVLDALRYAHNHRVVHRDIKPDNILLSDHHALVTDFGVAKAVSDSATGHTLTSLGVALGTPAYMAPEQAAAEPHVDHRADVYAVGALAYEMLAGRPPFAGHTAQAVLMAHMTQAPEPVTAHRSAVPAALNEIVLRCLEKKPADRWQRVDEILPHLDAILTPSGGLTPTATQPVTAPPPQRDQPGSVRVAALFGLAAAGVLAILYLLVQLLGLPDWVFLGGVGLMAIGLPIVLLTGHHERRRAQAMATGLHVTTPVGLKRVFTWRRALSGGVLAFAGLAVLAALFMASRQLGIGPAATLLSAGVLDNQERLLLADFENASTDSSIAESVTELLRIDLAQSPAILVVQPSQVSEVLRRMQREPSARLTAELADEVAQREGVKAFVAGEVRSVGSGFVITARVVEAGTGRALISARETAADASEVIAATDRLSRKLRERIGESLKTVRADPPLDQLTTSSLAALELYAQAERVADQTGNYDQAIALLRRATTADSTFAMAWRRIGAYLTNPGRRPQEMTEGQAALERAHALRGRLSDRERLFIEAMHATRVEGNVDAAITAYVAILEKHPSDATALNNLGVSYGISGRREEAVETYWRLIDAGVAPALTYGNTVFEELVSGRPDRADSLARLLAQRFPESPEILEQHANIALALQDLARADSTARALLRGSPEYQEFGHQRLALLAELQGRMGDADRSDREMLRIQTERTGRTEEERQILSELGQVLRRGWYAPDSGSVVRRLERLWEQNRAITGSRPVTQRSMEEFIRAFARAGDSRWARQLMDEFVAGQTQRERGPVVRRFLNGILETEVRLAEGRGADAAASIRDACGLVGSAAFCRNANPLLAEAFDRAGQPDSAIAVFQRFVDLQAFRPPPFWSRHAPSLRRLGELHEARGDARRAVEAYSRFVELWKDADPELQPVVRDVRERIARLTREAG